MKKLVLFTAFLAMGASIAQAQTYSTFTGADHAEFFDAGNWSDGIPARTGPIFGIITGGNITDLNADMSLVANGASKITISNGTMNVKSGGKFYTRNGSSPVQQIGAGAGNTGTLNIENGGAYYLLGGGADMNIGEVGGGTGVVNIDAGGLLNSMKALYVQNGSLTLGSTAQFNRVETAFEVSDTGTLVFKTDGATSATIMAQPTITLGLTSILDMQLGGSYSVGDTWTIIDGYNDPASLTFSGIFGTVENSLNANHTFTVHYGTGSAAADEMVVELTAIPEPATLGLVAMFGGTVLFIRRKLMM